MTDADIQYAKDDADIFSRGSLNLTYELLRKRDAELALVVRNICHSEPLVKSEDALNNKHSDYFKVVLSSFQVRAIVETLHLDERHDPGRAIMTQALIEDCMKLAHKMIVELLDDEKPLMN